MDKSHTMGKICTNSIMSAHNCFGQAQLLKADVYTRAAEGRWKGEASGAAVLVITVTWLLGDTKPKDLPLTPTCH